MGGFGSGRYSRRYGSRPTIEGAGLPSVTVRDVCRTRPRPTPGARLEALVGDVAIPLRLAFTPCRYGGQRPWLVCSGCGRRRLALYLNRRHVLRCRVCFGLVYRSQRLDPIERLRATAETLERRAGWDGDPAATWIALPAGMGQVTQDRLLGRARALSDRADALEEARLFALMVRRL